MPGDVRPINDKIMFKDIVIAGCGGFAGTALRFLVGKWTAGFWSGTFPLGTFLVNIVGCLLIGLFLGLLENGRIVSAHVNILLITGFCGGFTTFSAFAREMFDMGQKGDWILLSVYLCLSILLGILCVWAGRALLR